MCFYFNLPSVIGCSVQSNGAHTIPGKFPKIFIEIGLQPAFVILAIRQLSYDTVQYHTVYSVQSEKIISGNLISIPNLNHLFLPTNKRSFRNLLVNVRRVLYTFMILWPSHISLRHRNLIYFLKNTHSTVFAKEKVPVTVISPPRYTGILYKSSSRFQASMTG